jgi:hypothetical protein
VRERFDASGILKCPTAWSSAQVTVRDDIITTSAHTFIESKTCKTINEPKSCAFEIGNGRAKISIKIKEIRSIGYSCPDHSRIVDDWAILELEKPLHGIKPYMLPTNHALPVEIGEKIVVVSGIQFDFIRKDAAGKIFYPKSIEICQVKNIYFTNNRNISYFATDCDESQGASGSAILKKAGETQGYNLLGIIQGQF